MALDSERAQKVRTWLDQHMPNCKNCGGSQWGGPTTAMVPSKNDPADPTIRFVMPMVGTACLHCGLAVFFSAQVVGVQV